MWLLRLAAVTALACEQALEVPLAGAVLLAAAAAALALARRARARAPGVPAPYPLAALALAALAGTAFLARDVATRRPDLVPASGTAVAADPAARAARVLRALERELEAASRAALAAPGGADPARPADAFERLSTSRRAAHVGLTLFRGDEPVAWDGPAVLGGALPEVPPPGLLLEPPGGLVGARGALALASTGSAGETLVAETSLAPLLATLGPDARLSRAGPAEVASLARAEGSAAGDTTAVARVVLRTAEGKPVGLLTLPRTWPAPAGRPPARGASAVPAVLLLALLLLLAGQAAAGAVRTGSRVETTLALALLAAARLAAQARPGLASLELFGHARLAVVSPLDLFSSPGDLWLSGLAAMAIAALVVLAEEARMVAAAEGGLARGGALYPPGADRLPSQVLRLLLASAGTALGVFHLLDLVRRAVENSDLDLADFALVPLEPARLAALGGLLLLLAALTTLATWLAYTAACGLARARGRLAAVAVAGLLLGPVLVLASTRYATRSFVPLGTALVMVAVPVCLALLAEAGLLRTHARAAAAVMLASSFLLAHAIELGTTRAVRAFVRNDLVDRIQRQDMTVRQLLRDLLRGLEGRRGDELAGRLPEDIAYRVWRSSRLAREGLNAAVDAVPPDGPTSRFAHGLPLPPDVRAVSPGPPTLQEVLFQGRRLRVLAGAVDLADGTRVIVRVAEDPIGFPFFHDVHHPRELLAPHAMPKAELLSRADASLVVQDERGRVVSATAHPGPAITPEVAVRAQASDDPVPWVLRDAGRTLEALSFAAGERTVTILLPRPAPIERAAGLLHVAIAALAHAALLALGAATVSPRVRGALPGPGFLLASHYRKTLAGLTAGAVLPALAFSLYLRHTSEAETLEEIRDRGARALEFAGRILAEFRAAEPDARLDDSALIWVSQTIGYDLALYRPSRLQATSMRELFREGLLPALPDPDVYRAIQLEGAPVHASFRRKGGPLSLQVASPLDEDGILTLLSVAHEQDVERDAEERNRVLFVATAGLLALAAGIARLVAWRATEPVRALTRAAERVAAGDLGVRIASARRDEVRRLVDAFNRMAIELERQRAELRARTAYLVRLLENAPIGVLSIDAEGCVSTVNPAARALLGTRVEVGSPIRALDSLPELAPLAARLTAPGAAGAPEAGAGGREREEIEVRTAADRTLRAVLLPLPPGEDEGEAPGRMVILEDITDIVRSKKLDAWAEMARRVAHEVKNPLTPIQLSAEHLRRVYPRGRAEDAERGGGGGESESAFGAVLETCVATILKQVADLRRIAREFSSYAKGPAPVHRVPTDVGALVEELLRPYRLAARSGVTIEVDLTPSPGVVAIDPARIQRALLNLVENALAAMPEGGRLRVSAHREGGRLALEVSDTGIGFPAELRGRLFEPYFSTKDVGTGLGLANVKQAVEDHGGTIEIESEPGRGTRVRLLLPLAA